MKTFGEARREDLDETRRLLYAIVFRPVGMSYDAETAGTVVNALRHHSKLLGDDAYKRWGINSQLPVAGELWEYINKITALLEPATEKPAD